MYTISRVMSDDIVVLRHRDNKIGQHVWSTVEVRKPHRCVDCKAQFPAGTTMWSPVSNKRNRADRLCDCCIRRLPVDPGALKGDE